MNQGTPDAKTWMAAIVFLGLAGLVGYSLPRTGISSSTPPAAASTISGAARLSSAPQAEAFSPPPDSAIPKDPLGDVIRLGKNIFEDPHRYASSFVGNDLRCSSCHLDAGRLANSAPLWGAYVSYPAYRAKNGHVNSFEERLQGCFRYSMNGKAPPLGDKALIALETYAYFLAKGAPTGVALPGRGYKALPKPSRPFDYAHGQQVFASQCALCHGSNGQGQASADGQIVFPPLWGPRSYNWGAGMETITNAAGFIKANMPLGKGGTLSDEDAWDVAAYVDSHERPQDPRFAGTVAETRAKYHDTPMSMYGMKVNGTVLGENSPPSGLN